MEHDAETMRLQLLGDPETFRRVQEVRAPSVLLDAHPLTRARAIRRHSRSSQKLR